MPGNSDPILVARGLKKRFGGLVAVNGVDLEVQRGEIFAIIGANGAGKTTLFNVLSGFLRQDAGEVYFKGEPVTGLKPHVLARKGMVRTFQITQTFSRMTVLDTVITAALLRLPMDAAIARAEEILETVGLAEKRHTRPNTLTLPDKKLLELAKVLATDPDLIMLDEVMSGLTLAEAEVPLSIIRDLRRKGITFIIVEHIMPIVMSTADRIAVLDFGQKIAEGTPEQIVANPAVQRSYLGGAMDIAAGS